MKLREARERRKKSQEEVADHCGISRRHYQNIEYGDAEPTVRIALRIAKFLNTSPFYIDEWFERPVVSKETKKQKNK